MVDDDKPKTFQMRKTFEDVSRCQDHIYGIVKNHIRDNSVLSYSERELFIRLLRDAVGSYGTITGVLRPKIGFPIFQLSLMSLAYQLHELTSPKVAVSDSINKAQFEISELWKVLMGLLMEAFPRALSEARHMSAETDMTSGRPSSFQFGANSFKPGGGDKYG